MVLERCAVCIAFSCVPRETPGFQIYKFVEFLTLAGTSAHVFGPLCDIVFNPYETVRIFSVLYICLFLKWLEVFDQGNIIFMKLGERFFLLYTFQLQDFVDFLFPIKRY